MKLGELKERLKSRYVVRVVAGILTIALIGSSTAVYNVYGAKTEKKADANVEQTSKDDAKDLLQDILIDQGQKEQKSSGKDETVYIIADHTGEAQTTIVSEWLKNPEGKDVLEDVSELSEIENVKGNEDFEKNGTTLKWNAKGKDIYYQGTTKKEAPVTAKLTYYLDGKEIAAKDLAGKSGNVKIRFDYTNHEKNGDVYVPFAVVSGMMLDESFSNVEVTNGKVISNGDKNIVMGIALPGLKESLKVNESDFSEETSLPDYVEVTADVENFSLDMTMTVVMGTSEFASGKTLDLSSVDEKIESLDDATGQLKDGSGELADGMDTLQKKMGEFSDGVNTLQGGIFAYTNGAKTLADGIGTLKGQSAMLISGVAELTSSVGTLNDGIQTLDQSLNTKMSDAEKSAAQKTAKSAAEQAVEAQFADDSNPQSYNNIKAQAEAQFAATLTSDANLAAVKQQTTDTITAQSAQIAAQAQAEAAAQLGQNAAMQAQLGQLKTAVTVAGQMQYVQTDAGKAAVAEQAFGMAQQLTAAGFSPEQVAALGDILTAAATANVMVNDGNAQAQGAASAEAVVSSLSQAITGSAGQVAVAAAQSVAPQTAEATVRGVAEQAKGTVGASVADSVKTASKTAAGQAAAQAAVEGAETAKKQIAGKIEEKDKASGHSLVSGMAALNDAVGGMNGKMPQLSQGIDQLYTGSQTLASKNDELNSGASKLKDGKDQLTVGIEKLADGSKELKDGLVEFSQEGIEKLIDSYNGDIKEFADRLQAVMDTSKSYESFGGKAQDTSGTVKFIIKTEEIKPEESRE